MASVFSWKTDIATVRKTLKGDQRKLAIGATFGIARFLQKVRNRVARTTLGPRKWDRRRNFRLLQIGRASSVARRNAGIRFGQAINIAKKEGHSDFKHGRQIATSFKRGKSGRILKRGRQAVFTQRGRGWIRVLELFPRMTGGQRPPGGQKLWMQTTELRKSLDFGALSRGLPVGSKRVRLPLRGNLAAGFITSPKHYAEGTEKKFKWLGPVVRQGVNSGEFTKTVLREIKKQFKKTKGQR